MQTRVLSGETLDKDSVQIPRIKTGVPRFDTLLDGGLLADTATLIVGAPGTGKTTLGNQIAFAHAARGGTALFATALAERHERMLARLSGFEFFDSHQVGSRVHYLSVIDALEKEGLDGLLAVLRKEMRDRNATVLIFDGLSIIEDLSPSTLAFQRFLQQLQATAAFGHWTILLLAAQSSTVLHSAGQHVDGIILLEIEPINLRDVRSMRIVKMRGARHRLGRHGLDISDLGIEVFPRLEALVGTPAWSAEDREPLSLGISGLDRMLGGGLFPHSAAMLLGTPGSGKTLSGLHFIAEGAARGEPGLIATFHEPESRLVRTAAKLGKDLAGPIADGTVKVFWRPPMELNADAWGWQLLDAIDRLKPIRLFVDGLSDVQRMIPFPDRMAVFVPAFAHELRSRRVTTLMSVEIDAYVSDDLSAPVPAVSATMDTGILLRHVEVGSRIHRLVSVLKARESVTDSSIREFVIGPQGIEVAAIFTGASGLLTGTAMTADTIRESTIIETAR